VGGDQRHVALDGELQDMRASVDLPGLLALGQRRADADRAVEGADAGPGGPHPLGERALRHDLQLDPAGPVQAVEDVGVALPGEGADHLAYPAGLEQRGQAHVAVTGVAGDDGQVPGSLPDEGVDQVERHPGQAESADQDGGAVLDAGDGLVGGGGDGRGHPWLTPPVTFSRTTARA
jgi:hypothetical protein